MWTDSHDPPPIDPRIPAAHALPSSVLRVFVAVLVEQMVNPVVTVDGVRDRLGARSKSYVSLCLHRLRKAGLVSFEDGRDGTIRARGRLEFISP